MYTEDYLRDKSVSVCLIAYANAVQMACTCVAAMFLASSCTCAVQVK